MLTRATRIKLVAFAVVAILIIGYTGVHYAKLGRYVGLRGYYVVHLELANAGGLFPNSDVSYRGVPVGRVSVLSLTPSGVQATLDINDSAPRIPARLQAAVADLSAVGEEYVDLRPQGGTGPYLRNGSVIPQRETQLPLPVTSMLVSINELATSVPLTSLRTVVDQLGTAFQGQGDHFRQLVGGSSSLVKASAATLPQTIKLINDSRTVLRTQVSETQALDSFAHSAKLLAGRLAESNSDIRRLIIQAPRAATQIADLLAETNPGLAVMIANLLTTSELTGTRLTDLNELFSVLPAAVAAGSTVISAQGAKFGMALTFFDPLPCVAGYGGTQYQNGLDTLPAPLNTSAACSLPASSGIDVRGSAHAPSGGPVPNPARPGLARLLGISP
ncbi:MAG TPA: MlaD family protein [Streptosporangiaceae bacterium]|jgi:phospholipid/cholesterol/gamma-HCH transport system substrate-binding protein